MAPGSKQARGDWMTELPPDRRPNATPTQKAQACPSIRLKGMLRDHDSWLQACPAMHLN